MDHSTERWGAWQVNQSMGHNCGLMGVVEHVAFCQWPHWRRGAIAVRMETTTEYSGVTILWYSCVGGSSPSTFTATKTSYITIECFEDAVASV